MAGLPEFRKSQGVVPFGVGAIVDFPDGSLMSAGLDVWPQVSADKPLHIRSRVLNATQIIDGRLQQRLTARFGRAINYFLSPAEAPDFSGGFSGTTADISKALMPYVRFPHWHFCPRCRTLWNVPWNTPDNDEKLRCSSKTRLKSGTAEVCHSLHPKRRPRLIPVRFAVACSLGHIMDFPWVEWLHHSGNSDCDAGSGEIFLTSSGAAGLAGLKIECGKCPAKQTLSGAMFEDAFRKIWPDGCPGHRPWLGPDAAQPHAEPAPTTIQRGASNAYFAETTSSILIPPYSKLMRKVLDRTDVWSVIKSLPLVDGVIPSEPIRQIANNNGLDPDSFYQAAMEKIGTELDTVDEEESETEYRRSEYKAFLGPRPDHQERHDFDILPRSIDEYTSGFSEYFENVVLIPKLRETRVLTGFSRILPPEAVQEPASLSLRNYEWLPGIEVRGEGIFLTIRRSRIEEWLEGSTSARARAATINERLRVTALERGTPQREISPEFLLVHALAHVLIRQLIFDCGYDSSSLRERIYVDFAGEDPMVGLLLYTASGDSEGTLGGLVRQGIPERLERTFEAAIGNARMCSTDPLCIESTGQGINGLNLSACHACLLLPENSCEEGNRLLDRAVLIGTVEEPDLGFFRDVGI